jgi:phosphoserine phosphatase
MSEKSKPIDHVATFVAGPGVDLIEELALRACAVAGVEPAQFEWLEAGVAADIRLSLEASALSKTRARLHAASAGSGVDVVVQPFAARRKALLVADMDSTIIAQECIDELADVVGLRKRIAAITERAMAGEIEFEGALRERVAMLAGLRVEDIDRVMAQRITPTAGARALVATMRANGAYTVLVSGGFAHFTEPVRARLGFDEARSNRLEIEEGALTGAILSPILGREAKRAALQELCAARGLDPAATLAIGDGANDLDMLNHAGLGVAFHAKPKVAEAANARIDYADLTALLYAQGYRRSNFRE